MKPRQIRIIGGRWRGSRLPVIDAEGLRPTPDRIRETLDCFAGSGALGFEALSRGAERLLALEKNPTAAKNLRLLAQRLDCDAAEVMVGDALQTIAGLERSFDMLFIDPPYAQAHLRSQVIARLEERQCLREGAKIYFEWPKTESFELPSLNLHLLKQNLSRHL